MINTEWPHGRFQFVRYDLDRESFFRLFFQRYEGSWRSIYRWRIAIGPFDIRAWTPYSEMCRLVEEINAEHEGRHESN